ncbi:hypothetical protein SAMN05421690_100579 [Nitrosomonas sp. Nm51]|nr:hypothetical protein SAMN05421690_100579 [Nitrosomonas sp. Nm51]
MRMQHSRHQEVRVAVEYFIERDATECTRPELETTLVQKSHRDRTTTGWRR